MNEQTVEWRDCEGYNGYQVSNDGRVRSNRRGHWKELKLKAGSNGYVKAHLVLDGTRDEWGNAKNKTVSMHRLVAMAFLTPDETRPDVDHINGKPDDNRAENLRWCTHAENLAYAREMRGNWTPRGEKHAFYGKRMSAEARARQSAAKQGGKHFRSKCPPADEVKKLAADGWTHDRIAEHFGCKRTLIGDIFRGTHWSVREKYERRNEYVPMNVKEREYA